MWPTIKIDPKTKAKLDGLKIHPRQSYNEIIEKAATALSAIVWVWDQIPEAEKRKKLPPELIKQGDLYFSHKPEVP
jgi:hypothetical protein